MSMFGLSDMSTYTKQSPHGTFSIHPYAPRDKGDDKNKITGMLFDLAAKHTASGTSMT
jgi:hypothetical protein